ncbi:MAG: two-component system response regulator [Elusimicrobia bacterium CG1_02_56_21]|nr:MAG: two-component system response regulator [Elusimicrobia bacterium CG1_02_56_21]
MNDLNVVDILLVEDNAKDAELTIRALRKQNIANPLITVEDGAAALDFLFCRGPYEGRDISRPPKVILLDLKLPKVNGLEVLAAVKADERLRSVPVVIVTSSQEDPDVKKAYALGANSYVVKPVRSDDFIKAMSKLGLYWLLVNQPPK